MRVRVGVLVGVLVDVLVVAQCGGFSDSDTVCILCWWACWWVCYLFQLLNRQHMRDKLIISCKLHELS